MKQEQENNASAVPVDDGYWAALFEQEDTIISAMPTEEEAWPAALERANGQVQWKEVPHAQPLTPWERATMAQQDDAVLQLHVIGYNKGGLLVRWNGLQGFVPASQLLDFPQFHVERERLQALSQWTGRELKLKIIEVNQEANRLIMSERAALVKAEEREDLLEQIQVGETVNGRITNLTDFGAFVDLGGVEGLIHISELSWSRVEHPSQIVEPEQQVDVVVLNIDRSQQRIALSLKRLKRNPWHSVEQRYAPGQIVTGKVSNVVSFGAFIELEDELEGLVHISELAEGAFLHPRNVVELGDTVSARVLYVDGAKKRLALSMRGVQDADTPPAS